jgi:hypothetical protein
MIPINIKSPDTIPDLTLINHVSQIPIDQFTIDHGDITHIPILAVDIIFVI